MDAEVIGLEGFDRKLKDLEAKLAKKIVRQALRAGGKIVATKAKALVPVDTGALRKSIKVRAAKGRRGTIGIRVATGTRQELGIDASDRWYYPAVVEYLSTSYLRAAADSTRDQVIREVGKIIGEGLRREGV